MIVEITRCDLVPGTPDPKEPKKVVTDFTDSKGNPAQSSTYPGGAVSYHPGAHYEVDALIDGAVTISAEFEGSYPLLEIPNAMAQRAALHRGIVGAKVEA